MKGLLLICSLLASCVSGHMQMSKPYPIRSPLNKDAKGEKDYSYTNPLSTDGSDYPCKGYAHDAFHSVADYTPGHEYEMELAGSATHGGGSCQISLSYDQGKTFHVIKSMLGGCPLPKKYKFKVPSNAPSGQALLTWTWFNKIGNREMYMNCAQVTIKGDSSKRDESSLVARSSSFDSLPPIFIANVDGPGKCKTDAGKEANFPRPGPVVQGHLSGKGYTCESDAPFLDPSSSSSGASSSSSSASPSTSSASSHGSSIIVASSSMVAFSFGTPSPSSSASVVATPSLATPSVATPSASFNGVRCTPGEIICADDGKSWAMCAHGAPVKMGPVAAGTLCKNRAMVPMIPA